MLVFWCLPVRDAAFARVRISATAWRRGDEREIDLGDSIERHYKPLMLALQDLPLPVIAAVNGVAAGAGANYRACLRYRDRGALGELHPGFRKARAGARFGRYVDAAQAGGKCARTRPDAARQ